MRYDDFRFKTEDHQEIFVSSWLPDKKTQPKAVVQVAHGLAEHIARYHRFASFLTENGYLVYGNDHRGHGKTAGLMENVGFFAEQHGFALVVNDLVQLSEIIREKHPNLPVFLFGHSMGSVLVRKYMADQGEVIKGAILSGTPGDPGLAGRTAKLLARLQSAVQGKRVKSRLLDKLTFGNFNAKFKPCRTDFDWLSRDSAEVDAYLNDPYCGNLSCAGLFFDLFDGLSEVFRATSPAKTPATLPLYLFAGELDPVGGARGVTKVYQSYLNSGLVDVTLKLYPEGRHEMLNEVNRAEVFSDVVAWLDSHLDSEQSPENRL